MEFRVLHNHSAPNLPTSMMEFKEDFIYLMKTLVMQQGLYLRCFWEFCMEIAINAQNSIYSIREMISIPTRRLFGNQQITSEFLSEIKDEWADRPP
ncbi:12323_t:CDS:2 [Entrophospora sp. SA101]|nr:12323_t:CDS:2 [Entrophospora sp. SA101]